MVTKHDIEQQLRNLGFGASVWNQAEIAELPHIIHDGERISECVNGFYEGGVALLVATEMRLLLIDKKPLNYLNVEDLRFDMINEIDYSHRLTMAAITVSTGSKTLRFKSFNQLRLRHLINLVQEHMTKAKRDPVVKADNQQQHLEEINKQLRLYLMAQQEQLQKLSVHMQDSSSLPRPDPKLSDYLLAQRLLENFEGGEGAPPPPTPKIVEAPEVPEEYELTHAAKREVFSSALKGLGRLSIRRSVIAPAATY